MGAESISCGGKKWTSIKEYLPLSLILDSLYFIKTAYRILQSGGIEFRLDYQMKYLKTQDLSSIA